MNIKNLISELKRRNVIRVATAYAIAGWLIIQVATSVFPAFEFPDWTTQFVIIMTAIGFPISLIIAWAFELTPEGLKKTREVNRNESITPKTGQRINKIIIVSLVLLVGLLLTERIYFAGESNISEAEIPVQTIAESDKSIAVLPFDDFNAGTDSEYFADGLTEEILNALSKTPDLKVASRTSSFQYKNKNEDTRRIADALGVAHVLEGSVRKTPERIRVTAQLIRASDGFHLWSENYDRQPEDIIEVQEDIAFKIATAMETAMDPEALAEMFETGTSSVEAYNYYLEALTLQYEIDKTWKAFEIAERARQADPGFAKAHYISARALLNGLVTTNMGSDNFSRYSYDELLALHKSRIEEAIQHTNNESDRILYEAQKAFVNMEFRKALNLEAQYLEKWPSNIDQTNILQLTAYLGEYELSEKYFKMSREYELQNAAVQGTFLGAYFWNHKIDEGVERAFSLLKKYPNDKLLAYQAHRILLWGGEVEKAGELVPGLMTAFSLDDNMSLVNLRQACAEGRGEEAREIYIRDLSDADAGTRWIAAKWLGYEREADAVIQEYHDRGELFSVTSWLYYPYLDPSKFPGLQEVLDRNFAKRAEPLAMPYDCTE